MLRTGREGVRQWNQLREEGAVTLDLQKVNLEGARLRGVDFRWVNLTGARLKEADFTEANLLSAQMGSCHASYGKFYEACLQKSNLYSGNLSQAAFGNADLRDADLRMAQFVDSDLKSADLRGARLNGANLAGAKLNVADLRRADLRFSQCGGAEFEFAKLRDAQLERAVLRAANLRGADLRRADLYRADLRNAVLTNAQLELSKLVGADLTGIIGQCAKFNESDLHHAKIDSSDLRGADLSQADLKFASFWAANLANADLENADLRSANLTLARLIRCNLKSCLVDKAIVFDVHLQDLRGLPREPSELLLDVGGEQRITGEDARRFFVAQAIVEVFLTERLGEEELSCYHLHIADMHYSKVGSDVVFIGHRHEGKGSVLRFQGLSYEAIYQVLPDLLAPFRMAQAVEWAESLNRIPPNKRSEAISVLVKAEVGTKAGRWRFADMMAQTFQSYRNARVYRINEGKDKGFRLDVFTNACIAETLSRMGLPPAWDRRQPLQITAGPNAKIEVVQEKHMGDRYEIPGDVTASAIGKGAQIHARDISVFKQSVENSPIDEELRAALLKVREELERLTLAESDRADAVDDLVKLTEELTKSQKDPGRIQRLWGRIKEIAPPAAAILSAVATMAKLLSDHHGQ